MGKTTYSLDFNGATEGAGTLGGEAAVGWDTDASGLESSLNGNTVGGVAGWLVTGTGPFTIEQPADAGLFGLTIDQGTLDTAPSIAVTQAAPALSVDGR